MNCLAVLDEMGLRPYTERAVFVVGSTARGWNHASSDLDLVVVSTRPVSPPPELVLPVPLVPDTLPVTAFRHEGRRWELKFWLDGQIDQLLDKVSWKAYDSDRKVGDRLVMDEELFLERLITCIPLAGEDWVLRRRRELEESAFGAFVIGEALTRCDTKAETAMGQLAAGDPASAVLSIRDAFGHLVDGLLASSGEFGKLVKWRVRRFHEAKQNLLSFDEYWAIETMRGFDPADPGAWVREVFALCKKLSGEVEF